MSARAKSAMADATCHDDLPRNADEPQVSPIDDALWHLQIEARRLARLVHEQRLNAAQRRDLERSIAVLRAAIEWDLSHKPSTQAEPAL
jgi:hypothetical protein